MFWNRNNGPSSPVCSAAAVPVCEPSSFVFFCILSFHISLNLHMSNIRFQSCAKTHGVAHAPVQLLHGDFLKNSDVRDAISSAGLVYMNNPKFGPELNLKVLGEQIFLLVIRLFVSILCSQLATAELCPLMPKGCKLVLSPFKFIWQFCIWSPIRFASIASSAPGFTPGCRTVTCWCTKSSSRFVAFESHARYLPHEQSGWGWCRFLEVLRRWFARFRTSIVFADRNFNKVQFQMMHLLAALIFAVLETQNFRLMFCLLPPGLAVKVTAVSRATTLEHDD